LLLEVGYGNLGIEMIDECRRE